MKILIITGPSGSGKTTLSNRLINSLKDAIVISTDSYYKDNILIRLLSIFIFDIYDRIISIKKKEINDTLNSIINKQTLINYYQYDFKRYVSTKTKIKNNYKKCSKFLIIEGIFSHRLSLNYHETINIVCEDKKEICFNRRILRDTIERGRNRNEIKKKFYKSWYLFYKNIKKYITNYKVIRMDQADENTYNKLVDYLNKL